MTFDEHGVSDHCNHKAVHHGCAEMMKSHEIEFELFTLTTVNKFRKYIAYCDILLTTPYQYHCFNWNIAGAMNALKTHYT